LSEVVAVMDLAILLTTQIHLINFIRKSPRKLELLRKPDILLQIMLGGVAGQLLTGNPTLFN
jgi:hypothetical protein